MGFFSWDCKGCGHPLLSGYSAVPVNRWMIGAVVVTCKSHVIRGGYDGYGRLDGLEIHRDVRWSEQGGSVNDPDCYHQACWSLLGSPSIYAGGSRSSPDQGYFFNAGDHDVTEPKSKADMAAAQKRARSLDMKRNAEYRRIEKRWRQGKQQKAKAPNKVSMKVK